MSFPVINYIMGGRQLMLFFFFLPLNSFFFVTCGKMACHTFSSLSRKRVEESYQKFILRTKQTITIAYIWESSFKWTTKASFILLNPLFQNTYDKTPHILVSSSGVLSNRMGAMCSILDYRLLIVFFSFFFHKQGQSKRTFLIETYRNIYLLQVYIDLNCSVVQ